MEFCRLIPSPLGEILLTSDGEALTGLRFAHERGTGGLVLKPELPIFTQTENWLRRYFAGKAPDPAEIPLRPTGSYFAMGVWEALRHIPYGGTVSYGELARSIGCRSAQAVGGAVGRNPISIIIPCHRVIGADGSMTGYAGGIERKIALLKIEGVHLKAPLCCRGRCPHQPAGSCHAERD